MSTLSFTFVPTKFGIGLSYGQWQEGDFERRRDLALYGEVTESDRGALDGYSVQLTSMDNNLVEEEFCLDSCTLNQNHISITVNLSKADLQRLEHAMTDVVKGFASVEIGVIISFGEDTTGIDPNPNGSQFKIVCLETNIWYGFSKRGIT